MEKKDNKREIAQALFVHSRMTQKDIAIKLEVSEQTVSRWAKADHWDEMKTNMMSGKQEMMRRLMLEFKKLQDTIEASPSGVATPAQADVRRKLMADIRDLESKYPVSQVVQVAMDFCDFLKPIDFQLATRVSEYFNAFIDEQIEKQKWQRSE